MSYECIREHVRTLYGSDKERHRFTLILRVTLRLAVSPSWCRAPFGTHDQIKCHMSTAVFVVTGRPL
jgi:hypothetical protein